VVLPLLRLVVPVTWAARIIGKTAEKINGNSGCLFFGFRLFVFQATSSQQQATA